MFRGLTVVIAVGSIVSALGMVATVSSADQFTAGATNIALATNGGRVVAFSSQELDANGQPVDQWQIGNLIDGKRIVGSAIPADSYGWSSNNAPSPTEPEWFILAFKDDRTRLISRVRLDPVTEDASWRWVKNFSIQVSSTTTDGPWVEVKSGLLLDKPIVQTFDFPPVECRYLKLVITSNWGSDRSVSLGEIEVYETIAGSDTLDQLILQLENLLQDLKRYRDSVRYNQPLRPELAPAAVTEPAAMATEDKPANE